MINDNNIDKVLERFYNRFNRYNTKVLEQLGETIKQFEGLTPSEAHRLAQELKYSTNIQDLLNELSKLSGKSLQDMEELFDKVAKENVDFAETYYDIKGKDFIPYEDNDRIRRYVDTIKLDTEGTFLNLSRQQSIGFSVKDGKNYVFKPLENVYRDLIDEAVFNVSTGVFDYQSAMRNTLRQLADSGIKVHEDKIAYKNYSRRIDSSVRQAVLTGVRKINLGVQQMVGEEFGADGYEISAHFLCADDHLDIQGRQFSKKEYEKLNEDLERPIGELNCKHFAFAIILGVNLPTYTDKQLKEYRDYSQEKIKYNGKEYTRYEASQVQRKMETEIRKQKDRQIIARASNDKQEILNAQKKITQLTKEYSNFSNKAGLKVYKDRLTVSGYKRIKVNDISPIKNTTTKKLDNVIDGKLYNNSKIFKESKKYLDFTNNENIKMYNAMNKIKVDIYERKNLKKAYYSQYEKKVHTTSVIENNLNPTSTLWHELGHAIDNYKGGWLSNNLNIRTAMSDYYKNNRIVPQRVKDYFSSFKDKAFKEFETKNKYKNYYNNFIEIQKKRNYSEWNLENWAKWKIEDVARYKESVDRFYEYDRAMYYYDKKKTDMEYAQLGKLSDVFSAISKGGYNKDFCSKYGYHTQKYYNQEVENPTTELFANFTSLKMTGMKNHLDLIRKEAPELYKELEKLYKQIGDDINA